MSNHEPVVIDRTDWRITKAECSCGAKLELGRDSGSIKEQAAKLASAFQKHKKDRAMVRKKPVKAA
jgi:hypothetical protein